MFSIGPGKKKKKSLFPFAIFTFGFGRGSKFAITKLWKGGVLAEHYRCEHLMLSCGKRKPIAYVRTNGELKNAPLFHPADLH